MVSTEGNPNYIVIDVEVGGDWILALSGIINYILADRELRQWFLFQSPVMGLALLLILMMVLGELTLSTFLASG